jgi:hypothetical protein
VEAVQAVAGVEHATGLDGGADASTIILGVLAGILLWLALNAETRHTSTMTVKNAAFLALVGTLLLTILAAVDFLNTIEDVLRGIVPAIALLRSLIYVFASITVAVFFWVFNRSQT